MVTRERATIVVVACAVIVAFSFGSANILSLLASATSSLSGAPVVVYFVPYGQTSLQTGQSSQVDITIDAKVPINALGITMKFPQDRIEIMGVSKARSFMDLWTEDTAIKEDTGEVHFSGGTTMKGGLIGSSTALTLTIEAKAPGEATLSFEDAEAYAADGTGTSLATKMRSITFEISAPASSSSPAASAAAESSGGGSAIPAPGAPGPDLNGDGRVDLVDLSMLMLHLFEPYDPRYDLNMDGAVNVSDLRILLSKLGALVH